MATPARKPATAKTEAKDTAVTFDFDGETYSVPTAAEWDVETLEAFEDGRIIATVRTLLGAEQWAKYKAKGRRVTDLTALFEAIQSATVGPGN
jgi:hypothetical protein